MTLVAVCSLVLGVLSILCDIIYIKTHIYVFHIIYQVFMVLSQSGILYYSIKNLINKNKEKTPIDEIFKQDEE